MLRNTMETAPASEDARRQDPALDAVVFATERLAGSGDPLDDLPTVLARVSEAIGADAIEALPGDGAGDADNVPVGLHARGDHEAAVGDDGTGSITVPVVVDGRPWGTLVADVPAGTVTGPSATALRAVADILGMALHRHEAESRAELAQEQFDAVVERTEAILYTQEIDPDDPTMSNTTFLPQMSRDILGYSLEDVQEDPLLWRNHVHPDDRERVFAEDAETNLNRDERFSMEYRILDKDGRIRWFLDEARLVEEDGKPSVWHGMLVDVTERKGTEERLEQALAAERDALRQLRLTDEIKNTFLQAVSHDLRTPLAAIFGLAVTLERDEIQLDPEEAKDLARRIAANARRLDRLVSNLLDMDRLARGIVEPNREETDVAGLIRRTVEDSGSQETRTIHLDLSPTSAWIDAAKVERIVENLLVNAVRHTPPDTEIRVSLREAPEGIVIAVEDDGPGVPEELREEIFEPFRQGPGRPEHSPGVGVGLTLVQRFAELHDGHAWVEPGQEGSGASFKVLLAGTDGDAT